MQPPPRVSMWRAEDISSTVPPEATATAVASTYVPARGGPFTCLPACQLKETAAWERSSGRSSLVPVQTCGAARPVPDRHCRSLNFSSHFCGGLLGRPVADYRAYVLGKTGHILMRHEFESQDDAAALNRARRYVTDYDVEVWQRDRLVGTLQPKKSGR